MDGGRLNRFVPMLGARRRALGALLSTPLAVILPERLAAQDDIATAGSGGYATASANGGATVVGDINSGGNTGNAVAVGDTYGSVWVDGGDVSNSTTVGISADGGTAISDASGGSYNLAFDS